MSRPRSNVLKVGDKVSYKKHEGVVVSVSDYKVKPYNVHFMSHKRGLFNFNDLSKVRPKFNLTELVDDETISIKDSIDGEA
jgi:hypothetical protein